MSQDIFVPERLFPSADAYSPGVLFQVEKIQQEKTRVLEEGEAIKWKEMIQKQEAQLSQIGIYFRDGIWYFGDAKGEKSWGKIEAKSLRTFPHTKWNKERKIGDENGVLRKKEDLRMMFQSLGFRVATQEEEIRRWGRILEMKLQDMGKSSGIFKKNGMWYFGNARGAKSWSTLRCFPNTIFNKQHAIGDDRGVIQNIQQLQQMFRLLGLRVMTDQESEEIKQLEQYGRGLEEKQIALQDIGIQCINGVWYFATALPQEFWKNIEGINLGMYPNVDFNRHHEIGNDGIIEDTDSLKKMFDTLGLQVASDEQEKDRLVKILIGSHKYISQKTGIFFEEGVWYFTFAKTKEAIELFENYPSTSFIQNELQLYSGKIYTISQLQYLFLYLGFSVASEEQEQEFYERIMGVGNS